MTDDEYYVLFELRRIPQRNDNWMLLHGDDVATAETLAERGLVVMTDGSEPGEKAYRLNKPGRAALVSEFAARDCKVPIREKQP